MKKRAVLALAKRPRYYMGLAEEQFTQEIGGLFQHDKPLGKRSLLPPTHLKEIDASLGGELST